MEKLKTIEEYAILVEEFRSIYKKSFSNNYFMPVDMQRYIELGRAYYEKVSSGIMFLLDETFYYRACLYVDPNETLSFPYLDKKMLIRNVYRLDRKERAMEIVEKYLGNIGFIKVETTAQVKVECKKIMEEQRKIEKYEQLLARNGYTCIAADASMLEPIEALLRNAAFIKDFHFEYRTMDEKMKDIEQGLYLCIVDNQNHICAASIATVRNGIAEGLAIAVEEKHKMGGFAPVLTYERCKRLHEQGVLYLKGWVVSTNVASIKYHKGMGYQFTGRYADEWILNKFD